MRATIALVLACAAHRSSALLSLSRPLTPSLPLSLSPPPLRRGPSVPVAVAQTAEEEAVALAFGQALATAWRGDAVPLRQLLAARASVSTPLWSCDSADGFLSELGSSAEFFSNEDRTPPTLIVLSTSTVRPGVARVQWNLGLEWPSVWRSKINVLGESTLTIESDAGRSAVTAVTEDWHRSPQSIFFDQVTPRVRDILSLWNSPTAEHVPMWVESSNSEYRVVTVPPMLAVQAEWVETQKLLQVEQAPLPPHFAFTGSVKRSEWYSTVAPVMLERSRTTARLPGSMQQVGQRRRWIMPLPTHFADRSLADLPDPDGGASEELPQDVLSQSVQYVRRPAMRMAVRTLRGDPSNKNVISTVQKIAAAAAADGLSVVRQDGQPVFMQMAYDAKVGFNRRAEIAMAVWLSVPSLLQHNEVGVLLDTPCEAEPLSARE